MSTNPVVLNPVVVNDELAKAVQDSVGSADIRAAILAEAEKQTIASQTLADAQAATDKATADKLAADKIAAEATGFTCTEVIGGREFTFTGETQAEVDRAVANAYRVAYAVQPTNEPVAVVVDPIVAAETARKEAEDQAAAKAELELKFRRGDISAADYIAQSGAMKDYLAAQGVPLDALKAAIDQNKDAAESQSWADATQVFLNSSDWPGGDKNLEIIGLELAAMGLVDAKDKVAAINQAYESMKRKGTIFPPDAPAAVAAVVPSVAAVVPAVTVPAVPAVPAAVPKAPATSSSLFGTSSGAHTPVAVPPAKGAAAIPDNASPAEIIEAWKQGQIAAGKNPNAAFDETFGASRRG
jgi:hypothetical protein